MFWPKFAVFCLVLVAYNKTNIPCLFCLMSKLFTLGNIIKFPNNRKQNYKNDSCKLKINTWYLKVRAHYMRKTITLLVHQGVPKTSHVWKHFLQYITKKYNQSIKELKATRFMVKPRTSDIRMTYEYIRVTFRWHTSKFEWHAGDMRVHTSNILMTYEYIRVTYRWHTSTYEWHAIDIIVACKII